VRLRAVKRRRRHAEAQIAEIVAPGPGRTEPPCRHFTADRCGGCQWQHLGAGVQAAARTRIVGDALRRIGKLDVPDPPLVASPRDYGYRATITLTARRRGAHAVVGFHDAAEPDRVFPLEHCAIARPELNELWHALSPVASRLPPGDDVRLKLRVATDGGRHVIVEGGEGAWTGGERFGAALEGADLSATVWWHPKGGALRRMAGAESDPASAGFEQVNTEVAAMLRDAVVEAAGRQDGRTARVLDLYAGAGDTAVPVAQRGLDVTMVEMDARAVGRAESLAKDAGVKIQCIAGQVEDHLARLLPADVVIVNPPRAGLSEEVAVRLSVSPSGRLIYVSCDPATLARDLHRLGVGASQITTLKAYDMFPQTSHVETLVVLDRPSVSPSVRP
jgi:23S rRNA (uracil1939-C5)-methyltransferase